MTHKDSCFIAAELIEAFIHARGPKRPYCNKAEVELVYKYHKPCPCCALRPCDFSQATGNLYEPIWRKLTKRTGILRRQEAEIVDLLP